MCGIAGIFQYNAMPVSVEALRRMTDRARHRGPDDEGYVLLSTAGRPSQALRGPDSHPALMEHMADIAQVTNHNYDLGMSFRRLAIVDLSPTGHQPLCDESGKYWMTFNGEIYNYIEIREELKALGYSFYSQGDAEVLLKSYIHWGEKCLDRFIGMFAFVIYDGIAKKIFGARDRFGVKPLCYYHDKKMFLWASEEKQIIDSGLVSLKFDEEAIGNFLLYNQLHYSENTFIDGIKQIPAGHYFTLNPQQFVLKRYYQINQSNSVYSMTDAEKDERFFELFGSAVQLRLRSDVPVGIALSGGLDSSSIAMMAKRFLQEQVRTFSVYYDQDKRYDEREFIQAVLDTGQFDPVYYTQDQQVNLDAVSEWSFQQDGPTTGASPYSAYLNYKNVRKSGIIVLLNGQGGDEILGGYPYYFKYLLSDELRHGHLTDAMRHIGSWAKYESAGFAGKTIAGAVYSLFKGQQGMLSLENKKFSTPALYRGLEQSIKGIRLNAQFDSSLKNAMYNTLSITMLPHLLHWEDRNSMSCSIESRVPFLDHRLVEFMYSLPDGDKISGGLTKVILRRALRELVPGKILSRRDKKGFGTPTDQWTGGILRNEIRDLLNSERVKSRSWWDYNALIRAFEKNQFAVHELWKIVTLELFARKFEVLYQQSMNRG
ncbi:MAG: asparagine synthase (glutamine-hydrolyzing) [Saprospiraceae bacterium]